MWGITLSSMKYKIKNKLDLTTIRAKENRRRITEAWLTIREENKFYYVVRKAVFETSQKFKGSLRWSSRKKGRIGPSTTCRKTFRKRVLSCSRLVVFISKKVSCTVDYVTTWLLNGCQSGRKRKLVKKKEKKNCLLSNYYCVFPFMSTNSLLLKVLTI